MTRPWITWGRNCAGVFLVFAAAGCSDRGEIARLQQRLADSDIRSTTAEKALALAMENEQSAKQEAARASAECEDTAARLQGTIDQQSQDLQHLTARIDQSTAELEKTRAALAKARANRGEESLSREDFKKPPTGTEADWFAVYAFDLKMRPPLPGAAPTDDGFAVFSLRNLTSNTRSVRVDAGRGPLNLFLQPGGVLIQQAIRARAYAPLEVTVAGKTRCYEIPR